MERLEIKKLNSPKNRSLRRRKKIYLGIVIGLLLILPFVFFFAVTPTPPSVSKEISSFKIDTLASNVFAYGPNWLRKNEDGNWESYIEGDPVGRGRAIGELHRSLIVSQEEIFVSEIEKLIPSKVFQRIMLYGIAWFNRNLEDYIPEEFKKELFVISTYFSDEYDFIGPKFARILNYHAAHDIGHMVQNLHLVGCSGVSAWEFDSTQSVLLSARNFDFHFGDEFSREKIVLFVNPESGFDFVSITWGGFQGVVSGMNENGLSVSLNSLVSEIPTKVATPVSIIAREVLQYASNIDQAIAIIEKHQSFVSESFTISSLADKRAVVVEKTDDGLAVFDPNDGRLTVTNHFQSERYKHTQLNQDHIQNTETLTRFNRLEELWGSVDTLSPDALLSMLRDKKGVNGKPLGLGNPMAINQLLAHHGVVFDLVQGICYVSNYPYSINSFNAYSLNEIKEMGKQIPLKSISKKEMCLPADSFLFSKDFVKFGRYKQLRDEIRMAMPNNLNFVNQEISDSLIYLNPAYYEGYALLGDVWVEKGNKEKARVYYEMALTKAIPYQDDKTMIIEKMNAL